GLGVVASGAVGDRIEPVVVRLIGVEGAERAHVGRPAARGVETGFGRDAERPGFVSSLFFKPFQSKADSSPLNGSETNFSGIFGGVLIWRIGARFLPPGGRFAVVGAPMPSQHERNCENARIVQQGGPPTCG
ncbi:MAG: hypothetical protein VW338_18820, partial [Rhodospirillaceae bacterium]